MPIVQGLHKGWYVLSFFLTNIALNQGVNLHILVEPSICQIRTADKYRIAITASKHVDLWMKQLSIDMENPYIRLYLH
jgi:hypothetical protein